MSYRVAVVGGGVSGLATAYRLRTLLGDTTAITVFESTNTLGGKLRTVRLADEPFDVGAEAFLARRPEAVALIDELGLTDRLCHPTSARPEIRAGGRLSALPIGTVMGIPTSAEAVGELLSPAGVAAVAAESELPPISLPDNDVNLGRLLRARFGDELVDRLVDPLLGGVYAGGSDGLGLRATMPNLAAALTKGAGSLTAAAKQLAAPASSDAPVFGTLAGGLAGLVDTLAQRAKAKVLFGAPVRELTRVVDGSWRLARGSATAPEIIEADAVVLAVPAPAARNVLGTVAPKAAAELGGIELASVAVVSMALPPDTELPNASGILIGAGEQAKSGRELTAKAFTFSSRKWAHYARPHGPVLVRGSCGRFGDTRALQASDEELVQRVRSDLAELAGLTAQPWDVMVTRWGGGLPQYGVGHVERVARIAEAVAQVPGLAITGAYLHGVGIPACIAAADMAARRVVSQLQPPAAG